ncbi:uncharacterized protein OCT59_001195 [Rhizophagus irregularis]|uniref:F-box domain-containing protein n=5 Tax=Rhizophagus irregularis TaxID=588596 RepID=A0A2N1NS52_9GLOM|nr:hypothetical protein GLOIN_2v1776126 [Rhizophagus irregularis DAOM 181602=DAOM 197198]EXX75969.1 hypothetical protein RirG_037310 [Rhizophagus irregularis DAOM 197198w]PKK76671.1 hypothetical protein RhiirC2_772231 [Rhizophagus irregularis]POG70212.1 hypothetical protein GLOIN_2v1776126 [Rhizophagus irregularis DAOM 181602=DAOM 197198]UZN99936.1 hypothetical protein OCT59_001195 [Rhizophagus irregularis]|eukprot:XP_025177078.1 hypothetical protein GLOIN_2v1776126 [Rhizophagus irregularis DAOM 181602=DAOM 197198]
MTCSKIFSGDLPEITYDIIKYFKDDISTLYSCVLVNRFWCRLAIPLLWNNPFSIPTRNCKFIETYLHHLNDDLKAKLNEYKINDNIFPPNTLFNYTIFLKQLHTRKVIFSIEKWSKDVKILKPKSRSISNFKRLVHMSLIQIFIENEVKLHTLDIQITNYNCYDSYIDDILDLMLENPNFFHKIKNLKVCFINSSYNDHNNRISQIINLHQNLKKIILGYKSFPLYQSLLLSNDYNRTNTLNTIVFYHINFNGIINLNKVFEQLNGLESVHIIYCYSLCAGFIKQIIKLTKPFKVKSLYFGENFQIDEYIHLFLQKFGDYMENFGFRFGVDLLSEQQLLELITKYCKNIKFLDLIISENRIVYTLFNLIENINQNLKYLSITILNNSQASEHSSIILRNLGQILPNKLEYLNLVLNINIDDFEIFLKNSQDTFIEKFLIDNRGCRDVLSCAKEYIMKEKRVKYLAIRDYRNYNKMDLYFLKEEKKEFELYDIEIQKYNDLVIGSKLNFVKELEDI